MGSPGRTAACQEVLEVVSVLSGISVDALLGPGRAQAVSRVRSVAMHLLRTEAGLSAREVGRVLGRTEATVHDLSRLVARGERASDLAARARTELSIRHAGRPPESASGWKRQPMPDLAARRHAAGLRQDELAAKAGLARETVSRIEGGRPADRTSSSGSRRRSTSVLRVRTRGNATPYRDWRPGGPEPA
jgi:transcriptional regulator with XRE-family HTH domain